MGFLSASEINEKCKINVENKLRGIIENKLKEWSEAECVSCTDVEILIEKSMYNECKGLGLIKKITEELNELGYEVSIKKRSKNTQNGYGNIVISDRYIMTISIKKDDSKTGEENEELLKLEKEVESLGRESETFKDLYIKASDENTKFTQEIWRLKSEVLGLRTELENKKKRFWEK